MCVNNGVGPKVAAPTVNDPELCTMLTLALIAPLVNEKVVPLLVNVVHTNVPKFDNVPPLIVAVLEHVKLKDAKSTVPRVIVNTVHAPASPSVMVIPAALTVNGPSDLPLNIYVAVARGVIVVVVYVPVDDSVRLPAMFNVVVPGLKPVVPKFKFLNQPAVVNVAMLAPVVNVKFTAFDKEPPVVPNVNVLVLPIFATVNPPGPVYVKLVTIAILNTTVAAVVCVRLMFPALALPNAIERTPVPVELNMPAAKVTLSANVNVPAVNVYVPVVVKL